MPGASARPVPWWLEAGALGNELVKNLLLLGWGTIIVADFDRVEESNLSRSALFDADSIGMPKVDAIVRSAARLNPECTVIGLDADIRMAVSAGLAARVDVVFGCLDSVTARVALGQLAGRSGTLVIDGGLTTWEGAVRLFLCRRASLWLRPDARGSCRYQPAPILPGLRRAHPCGRGHGDDADRGVGYRCVDGPARAEVDPPGPA